MTLWERLPTNNFDFLDLTWPQIEPYYHDLETRSLSTETLESWMLDWGRLGKQVDEGYWRLWVYTTLDTLDQAAQTRFTDFLTYVYEPALSAEQRLKERLLTSGLQPAGFKAPLQGMRADASIFSAANLPLLTEDHRLGNIYDNLRSLQTVMWQGRETTLIELLLVNHELDRATREQAWHLSMARFLEDRPALNDLWVQIIRNRHQLALNAGLADYRAYRWQQVHRLDYTPADCEEFHRSVEEVVVPAVGRMLERRRQRLGVDSVRPWDIEVESWGHEPLRPFANVEELEERSAAIFREIDPQFGVEFETLRQEGMLDLDNRKGKMPSSYCATFPVQQRPFVFMNVVGTNDDMFTLFHECGHAFHTFASVDLPHHMELRIGTEFHEVAAIGLELLAAPHLTEAGFYTPAEAARARLQHLETMLAWWPYIAVVDAFQHWVYTHIEAACDPAQCDAQWAELWARFMPGEDWSGLEDALVTGWHRKLHIFRSPFYYIDYGLAQLGAVQIWQRALENPQEAIHNYRHALSLGGTVSLRELYAAAGAKLAFDAETFAEAVELMEQTMESLELEISGELV